jgi:hypothetical protein
MPRKRSPATPQPRTDRRREARIANEIVVDAYGPDECAMGWYYHLECKLRFPFEATCVKRSATSPLRVGETITVTGMAPVAAT